MKLGMEVGLGRGHIVLDGDPAPSPQFLAFTLPYIRGEQSERQTAQRWGHFDVGPVRIMFGPCLLWPHV